MPPPLFSSLLFYKTMNIADAINKAREQGLTDEEILEAIKKQNPDKEAAFLKAQERGMSSTDILNETIKQDKKKEVPDVEPPESFKNRLPEKPTEESKIWMRVFVTIGLSAIAAFSFTVLYRAFFVPRLEPISPQVIVRETRIPDINYPLIKLFPEIDDIQRFAITVDEEYLLHLRRILREEREGEIIRIIAEDQREEVRTPRITDLEDFFGVFGVDYPERLFEKINKDFDLYVYTGEAESRLGFVVPFDRENREDVETIMRLTWEKEIEKSFRSLFSFFDVEIPVTEDDLLSTSYQGDMPRPVSIRYREGERNIGLYYTITDDRLIFATSLQAIQTLIDRYYELVK